MRIEEERKTFAKHIYIQSFLLGSLYIGFSIGQGKSDFLYSGTSGFPDMVAGNGDGVPFGHFGTAPFKDIGDDTHGRFGRINIRAPGGVFL